MRIKGGVVIVINYEYVETENHQTIPDGNGWEYWSDRIVKNQNSEIIEQVAVWKRVKEE